MFREHPVLQINTRPGHLYTDASSAPYNSPLWTVKCLHDSELILQFDSHECTAKVTGMVETSRLSNEDLTWMGARTRLGLQQTQQYLCQDTGCSRQGGGGGCLWHGSLLWKNLRPTCTRRYLGLGILLLFKIWSPRFLSTAVKIRILRTVILPDILQRREHFKILCSHDGVNVYYNVFHDVTPCNVVYG